MSRSSPASGPAAGGQRQHRALGVVQHLGDRGVGQPGADRRVVLGGDVLDVEPGRRHRRRPRTRARRRRRCPRARCPAPARPTRAPARACASSQPASAPGSSRVASSSKPESSISSSDSSVANSRSRSTRNSRLSKSLCTSCRSHGCAARSVTVAVSVEVADQRVEPAVADHVAEVLAERVAGLALDLVGVGDDVVEAVVLGDPLGGGLGADPGDPGQVVGGLPHERRDLGVALRAARRTCPSRRRASSGPSRRRRGWGRAPWPSRRPAGTSRGRRCRSAPRSPGRPPGSPGCRSRRRPRSRPSRWWRSAAPRAPP